MSDYIRVPHFQQSNSGYCLPACVRIVLAHLGVNHSERRLRRLLDANRYGTPIQRVERVTKLGLRVEYYERTMNNVLQTLAGGVPIIVPIRTRDLEHWQEDLAHAVVLSGVVLEKQFWIYDPHLASGPITVS